MARIEAIGDTLEEALGKAHDQIPIRTGTDFAVSKVLEWGMQTGGFVFSRKFYVVIEADLNAPFRTDPPPPGT